MVTEAAMNRILTRKQIFKRFKSEWVLIGDPELTSDLEIVRGKVLCHGRDRNEVDRKAIELRPRRSAFHYTGTIPERAAVV